MEEWQLKASSRKEHSSTVLPTVPIPALARSISKGPPLLISKHLDRFVAREAVLCCFHTCDAHTNILSCAREASTCQHRSSGAIACSLHLLPVSSWPSAYPAVQHCAVCQDRCTRLSPAVLEIRPFAKRDEGESTLRGKDLAWMEWKFPSAAWLPCGHKHFRAAEVFLWVGGGLFL